MSEPDHRPRVEIIPPGASRAPERPAPRTGLPARREHPRPGWKRWLARLPGAKTAVGLWLFMLDDEAPDLHRLAVLASFIYLIVPNDMIWDFVLGPFGFVDDAAVLLGLVRFLGSEALAPYREQARRQLRGEPAVGQTTGDDAA